MRRLLLALGLIFASVALLTAQPAAESPAARKRQETIKSVEFVFQVKEITEPGALSSLGMVNAAAGKPFPAQQTTAEAEDRLVFDGEKVRYDNNLPNFDGRTGGLSTTIERSASDGITGRVYKVPREGHSRPASYGILQHARSVMTWRSTLLLPVFFWCRANDFTHAPFDIASDFAPTAARTPFKGLLLTEYQGKGSALKYRLQVEDAEGYVVRRVRASGANGPTLSLDIEYAVDATSGLRAPSEWTQTLYTDSGKVVTVHASCGSSDGLAPVTALTRKSRTPRPCCRHDATTVSIRSTNRLPRSLSVPKLVSRQHPA